MPPMIPVGVNFALITNLNVSCIPVLVSGIVTSSFVSQVVCNGYSVCTLLTSSQMQCWGTNIESNSVVANPAQTASPLLVGLP